MGQWKTHFDWPLEVNDTQITNISISAAVYRMNHTEIEFKTEWEFWRRDHCNHWLTGSLRAVPTGFCSSETGTCTHAYISLALHETKYTIGWWNCIKYSIVNADLGCIQCYVKHASAYQLVFCLKDAQALWKHCICPLNLEQKRNTVNNASEVCFETIQ